MTIVWIIAAWFAASVGGGLLVGRCLRRAQGQDIEDQNLSVESDVLRPPVDHRMSPRDSVG
jgi:hypothetical protein